MSRAVHARAGWSRLISIVLVIVFAMSVTAVAAVSGDGGFGGTSTALADNNRDGEKHEDRERDNNRDGEKHEDRERDDESCELDCDDCDEDDDCEDCSDCRREFAARNDTAPEPSAAPAPAEQDDEGNDDDAPAEPGDASGDQDNGGDGPQSTGSGEGDAGTTGQGETGASSADADAVPAAKTPAPVTETAAPLALTTVVPVTTAATITPSSKGIKPELVPGNPACPRGTTTYKIDTTPSNGTYSFPGGSVTISDATNHSFSFSTSGARVLRVIVKAGDEANVYDYTSIGGVTSDSNMLSTIGPSGGFRQISHVSFCYETAYEISGMKWEDINGDGLYYVAPASDPRHERLLAGWTIQLFRQVDGVWKLHAETLTGDGGRYEFKGLSAGTYKVEEVQQSGWIKTYGGCEFTLGPTDLTLAECHNEEPGCYDFGNMPEPEVFTKTFSLVAADIDAAFTNVDYYVTCLINGDPVLIDLPDSPPHVAHVGDLLDGTSISAVTWWATVNGTDYKLGYQVGPEYIEGADLENFLDYDPRVHGYKFEDVNGDGEWAAEGESALPNWTIELYRVTEAGDVKVAETTTDANGHYEFVGLLPGTYYVLEVQQGGYTQTAGPVDGQSAFTVGAETDERVDFGNQADVEARIDGYKFNDVDGDGGWDLLTGEGTLAGWTIRLFAVDGDSKSMIAETVTDSNGYYEFTGLKPGDYYVDEVQQDGWGQTRGGYAFTVAPDGSIVRLATPPIAPGTFTEGPGEVVFVPLSTFDFGNHQLEVSLYGYKFFDLDGNGEWGDGEEGLEGWTIELYERIESAWTLVGTTVTGAGGYYEFTGLEPGTYYVVEVIPDGLEYEWYQTYGSTGSGDKFELAWGDERREDFGNTHDYTKTWELTLLNDHESPEGVTYFVQFDFNGQSQSVDLVHVGGTYDPMVYSADMPAAYGDEISNVSWWATWRGEDVKLGDGVEIETIEGDLTNAFRFEPIVFGHKFSDDNANGVQDDAEALLEGWEIVLVRKMADGTQQEYARALTDAQGYYEFSAVLPGEYFVYEVQQDGWQQTAGPEGTFTVENLDEKGPYDFGNAKVGRIWGHKYLDLIPTGVLGDEDAPLSGWTIQLFQDIGSEWVLLDEAVTDASGEFAFEDLLPGDYYLVEIQQDGWIQTSGPVGPGDSVTLVPGGEIGPVDFLNTPPFEPLSPVIFGHKYNDADGDGVHESGETGLAGWTISLFYQADGDWELVDTTETDADGYFEFRAKPDNSGLDNGWYYVVETIPEGSEWEQTFGPTGPEDKFFVDATVEVDYGPFDFGNHTEGLPFLPFTGAPFALLAAIAAAAALLGAFLRRHGRHLAQG